MIEETIEYYGAYIFNTNAQKKNFEDTKFFGIERFLLRKT